MTAHGVTYDLLDVCNAMSDTVHTLVSDAHTNCVVDN